MTSSKTSRGAWRMLGAAVLVAVVGTGSQLAQAMPGGPGAGPMGGPMGGPGHGMMSGRLLQAIGASADQQAQVKAIMQAARDDIRKNHEAAGDLRAQMTAVFTAPVVDARAAEAVRAKMATVREADSKRMLQAMVDAAAVLTPEQRQQLADKMGKRHEMMMRHMHERATLDGAAKR